MLPLFLRRLSLCLAACGLLAGPCLANDYNEAISGDLSNLGLSPTLLGTLTPGSNQIFGTTGRGAAGIDRDYFTVTIPAGYQLSALIELPGTSVGGATSFLGVQAGKQVTLPTTTTTAVGLLGWTHYGAGDINVNLLPRMGIPDTGSSGFTPPLGAGDYAFWIQDFNAGQFNYGFNLVVQAVPEPGQTAFLTGTLLSGGLFAVSRRRFGSRRA